MSPFTVFVSAENVESALRLGDELHARGVNCIVLAAPSRSDVDIPVSACAALMAAGIPVVLFAGPVFPSSLFEDLRHSLTRVTQAQPSVDVTVDDLQERGWIPAGGEVYTEAELETITARLQDLGYA